MRFLARKIHYKLYNVSFIFHKVPYEVYNVSFILNKIPYEVYNVSFIFYKIPYEVYNVPFIFYKIPYEVYKVPYWFLERIKRKGYGLFPPGGRARFRNAFIQSARGRRIQTHSTQNRQVINTPLPYRSNVGVKQISFRPHRCWCVA